MKKLSHLDNKGQPRMVDISAKKETRRAATARAVVRMEPETLRLIQSGQTAKGDVFTTARLAGIMAAKQTPSLIPLCHPLMLEDVRVELTPDEAESAVVITATALTTGKTGIEMEAMTAAAVAALTVYDMCKAADRGIRIEELRLLRKSGGRSGTIILE
jgi:cyclic pyranopterin monophosphate synthase